MMKSFKKSLALLVVLVIISGMAAGCTDKKQAGSSGGPFQFSMMNVYYSTEPPKADDAVIKKIEEYTNTKMDIAWVPKSAYDDKVAVTIASGEMPQALLVINNGNQSIINGAKSGMFWDLTPYIGEYPNLSAKLNKNVIDSIKIDGKLYGIYRTRPIARDSLIYRKDWLKKLGLSEPKTIDDVYNMIKAFTLNDPDGNGANDTIGLAEMKGIPYSVMVSSWFGAPTSWKEDGTPDFMTNEFLNMLKWYKKLYSEKLINQDFGVAEEAQRQQLFLSGKAGAKLHVWDALLRGEENDLKKLDPNAELDGVSLIEGPNGVNVRSWGGYGGVFMFSKSSVKTEADLKKLLGYFDKLYDIPMQNLFKHGIEGVHYKVVDQKAVKIVDKVEDTTFNVMDQMYINYDDAMLSGDLTPAGVKATEMMKESKKFVVYNPFAGLISKTNNEKGAQLQKIIDDAKIKFILGSIDEAGWKSEIQKWQTNGGDKIIEEMKAAYASRK